MKKITIILTAIILALLIAGTLPAQVFADSMPEYISEVKIGMGKKAADAEKALAGYKILSDENGNPVDLNDDAGGGLGSKGEKVVYLGYKTTTDRKEAITDLALMNMKGGYSVQEYEALMETQMKSQIIPLVESFQAAIDEYRINYYSDNPANQARAQYVHDILDKFTDDDCGEKGLGELLLNDTKYEMGKKAYNKLSDAEKEKTDVIKESDKAYDALPEEGRKNHADILTILAQANGKATLMIENLITRASDNSDDTWIDRLAGTNNAALADMLEMLPTDAESELAKMYDSDARKILKMWDELREDLENCSEAKKALNKLDTGAFEEAFEAAANIGDDATLDEAKTVLGNYVDAQTDLFAAASDAQTVAIYEKLSEYEYEDGTLLDYFMRPASEISEDISVLYPLVACLSGGQRAGIDFVSLKELICMALTDEEGYRDADLDSLEKISIYSGVDRGIYQKGGVALTSDALRANAADESTEDGVLSLWTLASMIVTGLSIAALATSVSYWVDYSLKLKALTAQINNHRELLHMMWGDNPYYKGLKGDMKFGGWGLEEVFDEREHPEWKEPYNQATSRSALCKSLSIGISVAVVILALVTTYLAYRDMVDYYKVEFTPIPHYMVDEKDITAFDENGNKTVLKNQSAYYKAVECNRTKDDEMYESLGTCADMNGDVGKQWLALYAQKSDVLAPVLANSLLVKVDDADLPAGYTTGIHMFGSSSAFNLNSELYNWNKSAPGVMVYYKTDTSAKASGTAGSNFTAGNLAIAGAIGIAAGALISGIAAKTAGKKKKSPSAA